MPPEGTTKGELQLKGMRALPMAPYPVPCRRLGPNSPEQYATWGVSPRGKCRRQETTKARISAE